MFELREYQKPIAKIVFDYMRKNPGKHPLVALPTGAGKTVVLSDIILQAITKWPSTKVLVLSHVKEILEQDYESIRFHTGKDVGLYSAGLGSRETKQITVAGIQSVYRRPELFQDYKLVIIDECHLIPESGSSMYRTFFAGLNNPRYFGLTATPYRLGGGYIYGSEESIFDDLVYDLTSSSAFNDLVDKGHLCKLRTKATTNELDTQGIKTVGGDFELKGMSDAFNRQHITDKCIDEIVKSGGDRKKWLIFAIDIEHAESIAETLIRRHDIRTAVVHSELEEDRSDIIAKFKSGFYRAIVNVNVLTTGFNDPEIDLIVMLRPTKSPVIHVQTIGRGLRPAHGKDYCLILDFAGNTERLGPINDVQVKKAGKGQGGDPPTKRCPQCDTIHHPIVRTCDVCGYVFKFRVGLKSKATEAEVVKTKEAHWFNVSEVMYSKHTKPMSPDMVKVTYVCGLRTFNEYLCIEHTGYACDVAIHKLNQRGGGGLFSVDEVLNADLKVPKRIQVNTSQKFPQIVNYEF